MRYIKSASIFILTIVLALSCEKKDETTKGNSVCPSGYTGTACTTTWISKIGGQWNVAYTSSTGSANGNFTIVATGSGTSFYINNFLSYYYEVECVFTSPDEFTFSKGGITNGRGKIINENRIEATYLAGGDGGTFTATR